ncbi:MAG TPA: universal stress protein [Gemmataceae bacterium]|jgi:nucleotide-binding universal stress UspA family protein|nr:universal stress protein [Gemmataceae bacterium]
MIDLRRILVPTDFSKSSANALTYAAAFAEKFGAEILLLHVVQDLALFIPEAVLVAPPPAPPVEQFAAAARAALGRVIADLRPPGLTVRPEVVEGTPYEEIVRFARERDVDLIVIGTHGHTGLAHILLGGVTDKVVRRAPCPVLTVRHPEHEFVHP